MNALDNTNENRTSNWSLRKRALAVGFVTVAVFMILTGIALERAFRETVLAASQERLQARIFMLMGRTELDDAGRPFVLEPMPEPQLEIPESGAFAAVSNFAGTVYWGSASALGTVPDLPDDGELGEIIASTITLADGQRMRTLSLPVYWEYGTDEVAGLVFHSGESTQLVDEELARFRDRLQLWLGGAALCLLILQILMLAWLLQPLRKVSQELGLIESGARSRLGTHYPAELLPLIRNLNGLLTVNRQRLERYRHGLADLAHSLKTPLAVIRANSSAQGLDPALQEQLGRIEATIDYQLQRAGTFGRSPLAAPVDLSATVQRVIETLQKVYHARAITLRADIPAGTQFIGDAADLIEILGNLGDNACKWCKACVKFSAASIGDGEAARLMLNIDDDGPGIPAELRARVLQRGGRLDAQTPGQGLGLAMVHEMVVEVYQGEIELTTSPLGGARISCIFPST